MNEDQTFEVTIIARLHVTNPEIAKNIKLLYAADGTPIGFKTLEHEYRPLVCFEKSEGTDDNILTSDNDFEKILGLNCFEYWETSLISWTYIDK